MQRVVQQTLCMCSVFRAALLFAVLEYIRIRTMNQ